MISSQIYAYRGIRQWSTYHEAKPADPIIYFGLVFLFFLSFSLILWNLNLRERIDCMDANIDAPNVMELCLKN